MKINGKACTPAQMKAMKSSGKSMKGWPTATKKKGK